MCVFVRRVSSVLVLIAVAGCSGGGGNDGSGSPPPSNTGPSPGSGSAVLTWTVPTTYEDSSALVVQRFKIYSGSVATSLRFIADVAATQTTYTVSGLGAGIHYFAVTVVGDNGEESGPSPIGSKTIP